MILAREIVWRNPFRATRIPWLLRLYRAAYAPAPRLRHQLLQMPLRRAFHWSYALGAGGSLTAALRCADGERELKLRSRNMQFGTLYMSRCAQGGEPETAALLDLFAGERGALYDIGSNWGYYPLYLCSRPDYHGSVHAFEPQPATFGDLRSVIKQAGLEDRVTPHHVALSDRDGEGRIALPDGVHSGLAALTDDSRADKVELRRLDGIDLPPPAVVKLDVEGHETEVLAGAEKTLSAHRPMLVFESWLLPDMDQTLRPFARLRKDGYVFFQPGWLRESGGVREVTADADLRDGRPARLALMPFAIEQRAALREQFNVLACRRERLDELRALFPA
ncbi:MAG: FkbM family methyltransferase [Elusimicrobiota bacterium]